MSRSNNDDIETALFGGFWYYGGLAVMCLLVFSFYEAYLFAFWKWGRMPSFISGIGSHHRLIALSFRRYQCSPHYCTK